MYTLRISSKQRAGYPRPSCVAWPRGADFLVLYAMSSRRCAGQDGDKATQQRIKRIGRGSLTINGRLWRSDIRPRMANSRQVDNIHADAYVRAQKHACDETALRLACIFEAAESASKVAISPGVHNENGSSSFQEAARASKIRAVRKAPTPKAYTLLRFCRRLKVTQKQECSNCLLEQEGLMQVLAWRRRT
eukprot:6207672-Pleurochrysis_carterae.AAC.1